MTNVDPSVSARSVAPTAPAVARPSATRRSPYESAVLEGPPEGETSLEGTIPPWLRGRLVRTAPTFLGAGAWQPAHWFDGLGMLYRLDISPAGVRFAQRLLETEALAHARRGRMPLASFASPSDRSLWQRLVEPIPRFTDNTNVHVIPTPDGWLAMTETPIQHLVDGDSLRIERTVRYDDAVGGKASMLAHPEHDRARGELVNLAVRIGAQAHVVAYRQKLGADARTVVGSVRLPEVPYLHAFGLTPTRIVIVAPPLHARPRSFLWSNRGYIDHFAWEPQRPTRLFIMDRATGAVTAHEADPFFFFHVANAYDDGADVVVDLCAYPDASLIDRLRQVPARTETAVDAGLTRLRVTPGAKRATLTRFDGVTMEFPSVDRNRVGGEPHRVVWGAAPDTAAADTDLSLLRVDVGTGNVHRFGREGVVYGEPIFVGRPGGAEGEGVLLAVGSDLRRGTAELVVVDASSMEALATARLPIPVPLGFHGSFRRT